MMNLVEVRKFINCGGKPRSEELCGIFEPQLCRGRAVSVPPNGTVADKVTVKNRKTLEKILF
jgi:hypothetical protein